ncbi:unnamed protein product [Discula destructiva]
MPDDTENGSGSASSSPGIPELDQHATHSQAAQPSPESASNTSAPSMTPREQALWAMAFEELYQEAKRHGYGKVKFRGGKSESRKSGRVNILRWILRKEGITPYAAPRGAAITSVTETPAPRGRNRNGAIDHPEAILQTSHPALQRQIDEATAKYLTWSAEQMVTLAMERSYQLFKDSAGKMPTRTRPARARWLAAWDVLKSPREKRWWLGDGIDLVNKAKAMGYDGSSTKKYDVLVWLRSTPEEAEAWAAHVAEPSPAAKPPGRTADRSPGGVSQRPAKGSRRPGGWKRGFDRLLEGTGGGASTSEVRKKKRRVSRVDG